MIALLRETLGTAYQDVDVRELQRMLRKTGRCVSADGVWGLQTSTALGSYATSVGMAALVRASARAAMIQIEEGVLRKLATDTAGVPDLCTGRSGGSSGGGDGGGGGSGGGGGGSSRTTPASPRRRTKLWRRRGQGLGRGLPWILAAAGAGLGVAYILGQDTEEEEEGEEPEEAWI